MIKREFVPLAKVVLYTDSEIAGTSGCHYPDADGNLVRVDKRDGKTLERHLEGIEYFCRLAKAGVKIFPPLLRKRKDGKYEERDGFKRLNGMIKAGHKLVEAFTYEMCDEGLYFRYEDYLIRCARGGQPTKKMRPVEYGESAEQDKGSGEIINLYVGHGLKIEYRENIHVHWGNNRLALGRQDFDLLVEAFLGKNS